MSLQKLLASLVSLSSTLLGLVKLTQLSLLELTAGLKIQKNQININLTQMGSNGTHKNKTYLSQEKNSKVHIRIGKCIRKNRQPPLK